MLSQPSNQATSILASPTAIPAVQQQVGNPAPIEQVATVVPATPDINLVPNKPATVAEPVSTGPSLKEQLGVEFADARALETFKDAKDLAKSYLHLSSLLGKKVGDWSTEDVKGFNKKVGIPNEVKDYLIPDELGQDQTTKVKEMALKAGLTQDQAKTIVDEMILASRESKAKNELELKDFRDSSVIELKKEFGPAFDQRVELARRALDKFGNEDLKSMLSETGLGSHPAMVKFFANLGRQTIAEHSMVNADKATVIGITPEEAKQKIKLLEKADFSALSNEWHPRHKEVLSERRALYEVAYGDNRG